MSQMEKVSHSVWFEVVRGRDGSHCICICDQSGSGQRVGGSKPWGGGTTIHRWKVDADEVAEAIARIKEPQP